MSFNVRLPAWLVGLAVALFAATNPGPVEAQNTGTVRGRVTSAATGRPLPGAQVSLAGTGRGTLTNNSGEYLIAGAPAGTQRVRVNMIGYGAAEQSVNVAAGQTAVANFELAESAVALDEVVVTGTVGDTRRRAIGNAVAQVQAAEVVQQAPVANIQGLINGRAPGVVIMPGTGMVGSGSKIRIRGSSSLSLSNEPLLVVDGIRVDNATGTGPAVQAFGSGVISRLNDFNPDDIESIEVIKGPAAATLYGTEASHGVIHIITKKGRAGAARWDVTVRQGANWFANAEGRMFENWWRNPANGEVLSLNLVRAERERGTPIFETGYTQNYSVNVSGGNEGVRYYLGTDIDREEGVEPTNSLRRGGLRANLTITPSEKIDVVGNLGYVASRTRLACEAGCGGVTWGSYFSTPANLNEYLPAGAPPRRGYRSLTSEAYWNLFEDYQDLGRFTGSVQANHRPARWFHQRLTVGVDQTSEDNQSISERSDLLRLWSPTSRGGKTVSRRDVSSSTADYSGTISLPVREGVSSSTTLGAQYYRRYSEFVTASGSDFALPGLRAINAAAETQAFENYVENVTVGVYGQQQVAINDRLFLTAALRADDNSAFGEEFDLIYYPKASVAWVVSEEPFFRVPLFSTLRLRGAYGESGQQPAAFAALRTFSAVPGPDGTGTVTPGLVGNPSLGPERGSEIELGFDAGFLEDRLGLDFTVYNNRTSNAILLRSVAPSSGFASDQWVNIGSLRNYGAELMLRAQPLQTSRYDLDFNFSLASNRSEVLDLGGEERVVESAAFGVEHRVGYPVGSWFHVRVVDATLDSDGRVIQSSMQCDDGQDGRVPCFTGSNVTAPRVFLGTTNPKFEGAFTSTLTLFDRLRLYGMVDFKTGHRKWDHNLRVRCSLFNVCRENIFPLEYDPVTIAAYQNADRFGAAYINDASFAKLREISATYTVPAALARHVGASRASVTVAGRNLYTWTRWSGMEPEAMFLGGARGGFVQLEQNNLPQLTQFVTTFNLSF